MILKGKKILLAVTGSIAAYKAASLVRLLVKEGAAVQVLMTESAHAFITPLTLSTLSGRPVPGSFTHGREGEWVNHVELGLWADVMLIAPASANTLGKMAGGICDNLVLAVYLSARCPVFFAPAMDLDMYAHPSTTLNIRKLLSFGNFSLGPATGELASGLEGKGRMEDPEMIVVALRSFFKDQESLKGKKILVSAGPTQESIDPVRYISNHSSGKMGFELARALANRGAEVTLVSGPTALETGSGKINRVNVRSAAEMYQACMRSFISCDAAIMAAAVADFTPSLMHEKKIKKTQATLNLELMPTVDILAEMGKKKKKNQVLVGFALETDHEEANARKKLEAKNLDFIILNSLNDKGSPFHSDSNKITIIDRKKNKITFDLKNKQLVAEDIIHTVFNC